MLVNSTVEALVRKGIGACAFDDRKPDEGEVHIATMHRMKGLEFRCAAVIGAGTNRVPPKGAITPEEEDRVTHDHDLQRERCLLFVACTRAREEPYVSWYGAPSEFLGAVR